jgi:galactitol-specific phosphotransferase system IIB component
LQRLKKFYLLDEKIEQAVKKMSSLKDLNTTLQDENKGLSEKIETLLNRNRELSEEIEQLKTSASKVAGSSIDKEEIRKKIDRVLEKFGELQI